MATIGGTAAAVGVTGRGEAICYDSAACGRHEDNSLSPHPQWAVVSHPVTQRRDAEASCMCFFSYFMKSFRTDTHAHTLCSLSVLV